MARSYAGMEKKLGSIRDGAAITGKLMIQSYGDPFVAVLGGDGIEHELEEFVPAEFINKRVLVEVTNVYHQNELAVREIRIIVLN